MENEDLIDYEEEVSVPPSGTTQADTNASAGAAPAGDGDEGNKKVRVELGIGKYEFVY
jgi:hypothetical protein